MTLDEAAQIEFCELPLGYRPERDKGDCVFDAQAALRACEMGPRYFKHSRGRLGGHPLELQQWQYNIIGTLFGWKRPNGLRRYRNCYLEVGRGNGKALSLDTLIVTPTGWTTMGEVNVGDIVFDEHGKQCRVTGRTQVMHGRPCCRVTFSDGTSIVADEQHEWLTTARYSGQPTKGRSHRNKPAIMTSGPNRQYAYASVNGKQTYLCRSDDPGLDIKYQTLCEARLPATDENVRIRTTLEIKNTLTCGNRTSQKDHNHSIPTCGRLRISNSDSLAIPPYTLGAWLGDGHSSGGRFTCHYGDSQIIEEMRSEGIVVSECAVGSTDTTGLYRLNSNRIKRHDAMTVNLRLLGLQNNKHIPREYLRGSVEQRQSLLNGLMDTDGSVAKNQRQCEFSNTNKRLAEDVVELCRTLGMKPVMTTGMATLYGKDCGPKYRVTMTPPSGFQMFRLKRKQDKLDSLASSKYSGNRKIVSVEAVTSVPVRCIEVDSPSHLYLAGDGMIPTHNSTFAAIIAGLLIFLDDEPGAEVIGAAASRDQAREVFNVFKMSVAMSPALNRISKIYQNSIIRVDARTGLDRAVYKVASAEAGTQHGGSAHGVIFDELHAQPNRDLWDVLESSRLKRDQPMTVAITTAGHDRESICWEQHEYAQNVASGAVQDYSFLPVVYAADVGDDWTDPETWKKANPNLGVSIKLEDMAAACEKAKTSPGYTNTFKRLHLNIWTELETLAIPMEDWDRCSPLSGETPAEWRERMLAELDGEVCYAGLDLASKVDVAALCLWFPVQRVVLPWFWVPSAAATKRASDPSNRGRYQQWIASGFMEQCPGVRILQWMIRNKIHEVREKFTLMGVAYDKWNAEALRIELESDGLNVIEFGQTLSNFTEPTKELIASVSDHSVDHGHNPVLRWMASNLSVYTDPNENIRPDKKHSADKIDGMVAWLMAWGEEISQGGDDGTGYYDNEENLVESF